MLSAIYCDLSDTTQNRCFPLNGWSIMEMEIPCRINAKKSINLTLDFMHICSPGLSEPEGDPGKGNALPPRFWKFSRGKGISPTKFLLAPHPKISDLPTALHSPQLLMANCVKPRVRTPRFFGLFIIDVVCRQGTLILTLILIL